MGIEIEVPPPGQESDAEILDPLFDALIVRSLAGFKDLRSGGIAEFVPESGTPRIAEGAGLCKIPGLQTKIPGPILTGGIPERHGCQRFRKTFKVQAVIPDEMAPDVMIPLILAVFVQQKLSPDLGIINKEREIRPADVSRKDAFGKVIRNKRVLYAILPELLEKSLPPLGKGDHEIRVQVVSLRPRPRNGGAAEGTGFGACPHGSGNSPAAVRTDPVLRPGRGVLRGTAVIPAGAVIALNII
jgi:hypothetical protein